MPPSLCKLSLPLSLSPSQKRLFSFTMVTEVPSPYTCNQNYCALTLSVPTGPTLYLPLNVRPLPQA